MQIVDLRSKNNKQANIFDDSNKNSVEYLFFFNFPHFFQHF